MPYEDKIMVASGDSENPGEEEVGFETPTRRTGGGHTYDLEFNDGLDELTLTEDSSDKTTLPLAATFVGTTAEWETLSAAEKANYRLVNFTDDGGICDASNAVVAFTSSDVADGNANDWTSVTPITTGLNLKTLWERASMMFKNVRYLFKMLGTTDISSIGNGTVTGAISTINSGKVNVSDIKNNLTSTDTDKPLSALQGKNLNDEITQMFGHRESLGYIAYADVSTTFSTFTAINLSKSLANFKFVLVGIAYYSNGIATYGHICIPVSIARHEFSTDIGTTIIASSTETPAGVTRVRFPSDTKVEVRNDVKSSGRYVYVYGIK